MARLRNLKGIAAGLAGSFASRNNDVGGYWGMGMLCTASVKLGSPVTIALLGAPNPANATVQAISANYAGLLRGALSRIGIPSSRVVRAIVEVEFGTWGSLPRPFQNTRGNPFICTVSITDDRGHVWSASKAGWCGPHDPTRESQNTRAAGA